MTLQSVLLKSLNCLMKELQQFLLTFLQFLRITEIGLKAHNTTN